jgi:hypothetical protein
VAFVAFSAAAHSATLAVLLAVAAGALLVALYDRGIVPRAGIGRAVAALALGVVIVFAANYAVARRLAWTPGGVSLLFGRMLQDGVVHRFLDDRCPDPRFRLCDHRAELPRDADDFFWGEGIFDRLGRFDGLDREMKTIVTESLFAYPWMQLKTAAAATAQQLVMVGTGYGVVHWVWHTYDTIKAHAPASVPAMLAARQQAERFDHSRFAWLNLLHMPLTLLGMALLPLIVLLALRRMIAPDIGWLAAGVTVAVLANAFVCGALSGPHHRYGARVAWIAPLVVVIAVMRRRRPGARA